MPDQTTMSPKISFILGLLAGIAAVSIIGFIIMLPKSQTWKSAENSNANTNVGAQVNPTPTPQEPLQGNPALLPPVSSEDYVRGDANAKITLIEYSDFECPFCSRHAPTIDKILENYKGKVRLVFRHFPLSFHPEAQKAAEASECAGEQGKFWEMHDKIFEANEAKNMSVDTWKKAAKDLKLNTAKFNDCLDSGKYLSKIQNEQADGQAAGVEGTPATFVNGKLISGAVPYEQFKSVIDSIL